MSLQAFTVTPCAACGMDSALVVLPPKYCCVACGETGVATYLGRANVLDPVPDGVVAAAWRALWEERPSMKEFCEIAREQRKREREAKEQRGRMRREGEHLVARYREHDEFWDLLYQAAADRTRTAEVIGVKAEGG